MAWLMQELNRRGLFFVDSRTTAATVARRLAIEYRVPSADRRVFLDNVQTVGAVRAQFRQLLDIARREGTALAIGLTLWGRVVMRKYEHLLDEEGDDVDQ